jgi:hypothetical protein
VAPGARTKYPIIYESYYEVNSMTRYTLILTRFTFLMLAITAIASCTNKKAPDETGPISPDISQGDTLVLLKPVEVPSGSNAVYFQQGQVVEENAIDMDAPYCRLELAGAVGTMRTIQPQRFGIKNDMYNDQAAGPTGGQVPLVYLSFNAKQDSEVKGMACGWPGESANPNFVSAEQIGTTLTGYFSIEVSE